MNKNHLHVTCAIIEQNGCVLAAQRSRAMAMPLKWEFPGGKIKPGDGDPASLPIFEFFKFVRLEI